MTDTESCTADRVSGLVSLRHPVERGEWAVFYEFEPAPAHRSGRRWDVFAVRAWQPAGWRVGYEVKVSRSDFLHELAEPAKRAKMEAVCHECWFAVGPKVCTAAEVPDGWGLLEMNGAGLITRRAAPARTPEPPSNDLLAAVARCAWRQAAGEDWGEVARPLPRAVWLLAGEVIGADRLREFCDRVVTRSADGRVTDALERVFRRLGRWGRWSLPTKEDGSPDLGAVADQLDYRLQMASLLIESAGLGVEPDVTEVRKWLQTVHAAGGGRPASLLRLARRAADLAGELEMMAAPVETRIASVALRTHGEGPDAETDLDHGPGAPTQPDAREGAR